MPARGRRGATAIATAAAAVSRTARPAPPLSPPPPAAAAGSWGAAGLLGQEAASARLPAGAAAAESFLHPVRRPLTGLSPPRSHGSTAERSAAGPGAAAGPRRRRILWIRRLHRARRRRAETT